MERFFVSSHESIGLKNCAGNSPHRRLKFAFTHTHTQVAPSRQLASQHEPQRQKTHLNRFIGGTLNVPPPRIAMENAASRRDSVLPRKRHSGGDSPFSRATARMEELFRDRLAARLSSRKYHRYTPQNENYQHKSHLRGAPVRNAPCTIRFEAALAWQLIGLRCRPASESGQGPATHLKTLSKKTGQ